MRMGANQTRARRKSTLLRIKRDFVRDKGYCFARTNHKVVKRSDMPAHYVLDSFPPATLEWSELIPLVGPAAAAVARYDGLLRAIPNATVLLAPMTTQEAVLSSKIEGTQATMGEVFEFEANATPENLPSARRDDIQEILNYRRAMRHAEQTLTSLPLSLRVIREVHRILLDGVRGQSKRPGELRTIPNWIGPAGCTVETATFVPIGADALPQAMSRWESYLHADAADTIVQLAIVHAEFEALHPFLDGNGRLGRMLVPLFLWQRGLITSPMFYLSAYLEQNRAEYYERLLAVSRDQDWTGWCRFFLQGVKQQAEDNLQRAEQILALYDELKAKVPDWTHSQYAIHALDWIFSRPIFKSTDFVNSGALPGPTARRILAALKDAKLLLELRPASGRRAAVFAFHELLAIAER